MTDLSIFLYSNEKNGAINDGTCWGDAIFTHQVLFSELQKYLRLYMLYQFLIILKTLRLLSCIVDSSKLLLTEITIFTLKRWQRSGTSDLLHLGNHFNGALSERIFSQVCRNRLLESQRAFPNFRTYCFYFLVAVNDLACINELIIPEKNKMLKTVLISDRVSVNEASSATVDNPWTRYLPF